MLHFSMALTTTPLKDLPVRPPSDPLVPPSAESEAHGLSRQTIFIGGGADKTASAACLLLVERQPRLGGNEIAA